VFRCYAEAGTAPPMITVSSQCRREQYSCRHLPLPRPARTPAEADHARLAQLVRGHWTIENSIHRVRDVTYREDAHRARTGNAPAVLACIRNLVTTTLRLAGAANIAAARRTVTLTPKTLLRLLRRPAKPDTPPM